MTTQACLLPLNHFKDQLRSTQLTERFGVARIRAHDLWHYQHRLIRKILAHTTAVYLNLQLGRPPPQLEGLVAA